MKFHRFDKLILFGGSYLVHGIVRSLGRDIASVLCVVSAPRHLNEKIRGVSLRTLLRSRKIRFYETDDINSDKRLRAEVTRRSIGLAAGAAWAFEKKTVKLFTRHHVLDFMGIDLPRSRGGAHHTWRILHQNYLGAMNIQIIEGGSTSFHRGRVVARQAYRYPETLKRPIDFYKYGTKREVAFVLKFLEDVQRGASFTLSRLNESESSCYPFLSTANNGYVDWGWQGRDIYMFINAFDRPYSGAVTFLGGRKIHLRECSIEKAEEKYHPFTSGIVVRKNRGSLFIATQGHVLKVNDVRDDVGRDVMNAIKEGARLYTPRHILDAGYQFAATYTANGLTTDTEKK